MKRPISKPKQVKNLPAPGLRQPGMPGIHQKAVERLAHGLKPVKPVASPLVQWLTWLALAVMALSLLFFLMPLRADLFLNLKFAPFDLMLLFIFSGALFAAWGTIEASIPGEKLNMNWKLLLPCLLWVAAFFSFIFFLPWKAENYLDHFTPLPCFAVVFFIGLIFWVGLGLLIRRNAPLNPRQVGLWSGLSSFLLGLGIVTVHCDSHNLYHVCFEHFLPVLVYSLLVGWIGARWVSGWKRKPLPQSP